MPSFESKRICVQETLAMSEMSLDRASEEKAQIMGHVNPKFATQRGLPVAKRTGQVFKPRRVFVANGADVGKRTIVVVKHGQAAQLL